MEPNALRVFILVKVLYYMPSLQFEISLIAYTDQELYSLDGQESSIMKFYIPKFRFLFLD